MKIKTLFLFLTLTNILVFSQEVSDSLTNEINSPIDTIEDINSTITDNNLKLDSITQIIDNDSIIQEPTKKDSISIDSVKNIPVVIAKIIDSTQKNQEIKKDSIEIIKNNFNDTKPKDSVSTHFDNIRGRAYNSVNNLAAASTIGDILNTPYRMAQKKLIYLEPTNSFAAIAFGNSLTKFISFDNTDNLSYTTIGIANKSFGLSLSYALGKEWNSTETTYVNKKNTTENDIVYAQDKIAGAFAMPIGMLDFQINASWTTNQREVDTKTEKKTTNNTIKNEIDQDFWDFYGQIAISNTPSARNVFFNANIEILRHEIYTQSKNTDKENPNNDMKSKITGNNANLTITPSFNIGTSILKASNARVLLGINTRIPLVFFDEIKEKSMYDDDNVNKDSYFTMGIYAKPNILGELGIGNCWIVFGAASYDWAIFNLKNNEFIEDYNDEDNKETTKLSIINMTTGIASIEAGARFQYKNFALEASIANGFYNNPLTGFNGGNMIANLGGFIYF